MPRSGYVAAGAAGYMPRVHADHAQVLADAALFDDADALVTRALDMLSKDGNEIEMAGALVTAAEIRLAQRDHAGARAAADEAAGWYRKQGREGWVAVTTSLALQAAAREDEPAIELADQLDEVAVRLDDGGLGAEATRSRLVAALVRAEARRDDVRRPGPCRYPPASPQRSVGGPHPPRPRRRRRRAEAGRSGGGTAGDQPWPECGDVEPSLTRVTRNAGPRSHPRQRLDGDRRTHRRFRRATTGTVGPHRGNSLDGGAYSVVASAGRSGDRPAARRAAQHRGDAGRSVGVRRGSSGCGGAPTPVSSGTFGAGRDRHGVIRRPASPYGGRSTRRSRSSRIGSCWPTPGSTGVCTPSRWSAAGPDCTTSARSTTSTSGSRR